MITAVSRCVTAVSRCVTENNRRKREVLSSSIKTCMPSVKTSVTWSCFGYIQLSGVAFLPRSTYPISGENAEPVSFTLDLTGMEASTHISQRRGIARSLCGILRVVGDNG